MTWFSVALLIALIGGNLALLVWLFRRRWRWGAALLAVQGLLTLYAAWVEPRLLIIVRHTVEVPGLSAPVRVAAIGDPQPTRLHWSPRRLRTAFERAEAEDPDILLWLGDYAYDPGWARVLGVEDLMAVDPEEVVYEIGRIEAPMGAYAILGNHDWAWDGSRMADLLEAAGVTVLIDAAAKAEHPKTGAALWIVGFDDLSAPRVVQMPRALGMTDDSAPTIAMTHSPVLFAFVPETVALTLAGHTHGGQVALPLIGPLATPDGYPEYTYGMFEDGPRRLYTTAGIGTGVAPVRFGRPPEIAIIDLVPAE